MTPRFRFLVTIAVLCVAAASFAAPKSQEAFAALKAKTDVVYLLANSSIIVGPDVGGRSEDITFTGPVSVPKYPLKGFDRRKLPSGRYQIDFELTNSQLRGESYLMDGPIVLGEHPDLRSLGTITQHDPGQDYPADFIVQRKVLIETPKGTMFNEDPVPVRGVIDSIPPVRHGKAAAAGEMNVFHGKELPVAMLDPDGNIAGWFYSKVHVAFAVNPTAIYRFMVSGELALRDGDRTEKVAISGPVEIVEMRWDDRTVAEIIKVALRGESQLLGGRIMLTESFRPDERFSRGTLGEKSGFDFYVEVKAPHGNLDLAHPMALRGRAARAAQLDQVALTAASIPVFHLDFDEAAEQEEPVVDEAGRTLATLTGLTLRAEEVHARRPCCPVKRTASVRH